MRMSFFGSIIKLSSNGHERAADLDHEQGPKESVEVETQYFRLYVWG